MSKSLGNIVNPILLLDTFGIDSVRLYFMSQGPMRKDMDFDLESLALVHNSLLCGQYLNMLHRTLSKKVLKKFDFSQPLTQPSTWLFEESAPLLSKLEGTVDLYIQSMSTYDIPGAIEHAESLLEATNTFLSLIEFWKHLGDDSRL